MRSVVMLLIGLVVGALCSITLLRALSEGNEYPKGVMALMGKHFGALREVADAGQCEAATVAHHAATLRQVAERAGLSATSVQSAELNEMKGSIQLDSLRKLADVLDCDLLYALVPRSSLANTLERQAKERAERIAMCHADCRRLFTC